MKIVSRKGEKRWADTGTNGKVLIIIITTTNEKPFWMLLQFNKTHTTKINMINFILLPIKRN